MRSWTCSAWWVCQPLRELPFFDPLGTCKSSGLLSREKLTRPEPIAEGTRPPETKPAHQAVNPITIFDQKSGWMQWVTAIRRIRHASRAVANSSVPGKLIIEVSRVHNPCQC